MKTEKCSYCIYWEEKVGFTTGKCRYNPPVIAALSPNIDNTVLQDFFRGIWPNTLPNDYCSKFKRTLRIKCTGLNG